MVFVAVASGQGEALFLHRRLEAEEERAQLRPSLSATDGERNGERKGGGKHRGGAARWPFGADAGGRAVAVAVDGREIGKETAESRMGIRVWIGGSPFFLRAIISRHRSMQLNGRDRNPNPAAGLWAES